jgi:hypothetical protein
MQIQNSFDVCSNQLLGILEKRCLTLNTVTTSFQNYIDLYFQSIRDTDARCQRLNLRAIVA